MLSSFSRIVNQLFIQGGSHSTKTSNQSKNTFFLAFFIFIFYANALPNKIILKWFRFSNIAIQVIWWKCLYFLISWHILQIVCSIMCHCLYEWNDIPPSSKYILLGSHANILLQTSPWETIKLWIMLGWMYSDPVWKERWGAEKQMWQRLCDGLWEPTRILGNTSDLTQTRLLQNYLCKASDMKSESP